MENKNEFKETLLGFLADVTTVPKNPTLNLCPDGFYTLSPFLLIKERDYINMVKERAGKEPPTKHWIIIKFFTEKHRYIINAVLYDNKVSGEEGYYLGAGVDTRKPRSGEDWNRGNDLIDGKFNRETWERIKNAIIKHEMTGLSKYIVNGRYQNEK